MLPFRLLGSLFRFSKSTTQKFSSYKEVTLKLSDIETSFTRSQGPGGQNVNKVNSKAEIRMNLNSCDWIEPQTIEKIRSNQKNHINSQGQIVLTSQIHREQSKNLQQCHRKLQKIIYTHSLIKKERIIAEYQEPEYMRERRVSDKKRKGELKENRKKPKLW